MKALKLWSMSILIASALLLSAGRNARAASPSPVPAPSPQRAIQGGEQPALPKQESAQHPAPPTITDLAGSPANTPAPGNKGDDSQSNSLLAIGTFIFIALTGVATALIAKFNKQLVAVTNEMTNAAKAAADAADAALHINRPSIVITGIAAQVGIHQKTRTPDTLIGYTPQIYNLGSGPAEIIGAFSHSRVFDAYETRDDIPNLAAEEPSVGDLIWDGESDRREFPRTILGAAESFDNYMAGYTPVVSWIDGDIEKVKDGKKRRAIYGLIRYQSSVKEYFTRFFYWYDPQRRSFRRADRPELNQRT
jgi:hypothetical protein